MTIYLIAVRGRDVDNYPTVKATTDYGYFTSLEDVKAWIDSQENPDAWDYEDVHAANTGPLLAGDVNDLANELFDYQHPKGYWHGGFSDPPEATTDEVAQKLLEKYILIPRSGA